MRKFFQNVDICQQLSEPTGECLIEMNGAFYIGLSETYNQSTHIWPILANQCAPDSPTNQSEYAAKHVNVTKRGKSFPALGTGFQTGHAWVWHDYI